MLIRFVSTTCEHIRVQLRANGAPLAVVTLAELQDAVQAHDSLLLLRLKFLVRDYIATGSSVTVGGLRSYLEDRDI